MALQKLTVVDEFTPADLLFFRAFRAEMPGAVEAMLTRNPGLAADGQFAALGRLVEVEIETPRDTPPVTKRVIRLWD